MRHLAMKGLLFVVVPAAAIVMATGFWLRGARYVTTENAYVKTDIAKLAAEISGKVIEVRAYAHMKVKVGDVLVKIDPEPFELALESALAELDTARQEIRTRRAELAEARTELGVAEHRAAYFRKRLDRQTELRKRGIVSGSRHDEMENDFKTAQDRVGMMRQKIRRVLTALGSDSDGPVDNHPLVRAKQARVDRARLELERTVITAPVNGTVVTVPLVRGEQITAAKPLFAIVTDRNFWVDANFKETELTHVRVGQKASIVLDIYPGISWEAEVKSISPATGSEFALLPPQNASGNWVKVVQRLPIRLHLLPRPDAPPLRAGMAAAVSIDTRRQRKLSDLLGGLSAFATPDAKKKPSQPQW